MHSLIIAISGGNTPASSQTFTRKAEEEVNRTINFFTAKKGGEKDEAEGEEMQPSRNQTD